MFPTAISIGPPSSSSYLPLTAFETLFLLLALLQISMLQTAGILPLIINNLFTGDPSGRRRKRKRRRVHANANAHAHPLDIENLRNVPSLELMKELFHALHKLDKFDCVGKTFCVLRDMDLEDLLENPASQGTSCPYRDLNLDDLTTTESSAPQASGRLGLFKAILETLGGSDSNPNPRPNSGTNENATGLDYDYDYGTSYEEDEPSLTSTTPYSSNNTQSFSSFNTQSPRPRPEPESGQSRPASQSINVSVCDHLYKSSPISSQDIKMYTHMLFKLASIA